MSIARAEAAGRIAGAALLVTGMTVAGAATSGTSADGATHVRTGNGAGLGNGAAAPVPPRHDPAEIAAVIARRLGSRTAGAYLDRRGRPVVTVTRREDAAAVRALGVTPQPVPRGAASLAGVAGRLDRQVRVPGTAWSVEPATAQVV